MERKRTLCSFLFIVLILVFSACHPRRVSDIKLAMTKEEVVSLWGQTNLITYQAVNGTTLETWEYHFAGSSSICQITFVQDRVAANPKCDRYQRAGWHDSGYYYPYPYYDPYPYYYGGYFDFYFPYRYPYRYRDHPHPHHRPHPDRK